MAARGTPIEGWWAWWPFHGAEYARRFATKEDAIGYLPNVKTKHGKPFPLGEKHIMRVAWDYGRYDHKGWTNDEPIVIPQEEVEAQFMAQGEVNAEQLRLGA